MCERSGSALSDHWCVQDIKDSSWYSARVKRLLIIIQILGAGPMSQDVGGVTSLLKFDLWNRSNVDCSVCAAKFSIIWIHNSERYG